MGRVSSVLTPLYYFESHREKRASGPLLMRQINLVSGLSNKR